MGWFSKFINGGATAPSDNKPEVAFSDQKSELGVNTGQSADSTRGSVIEFLRLQVVAITKKQGRALEANEVDAQVDLYEAGYIDSLSVSELLVQAEGRFGVRLPDYIVVGSVKTLEALADYISVQNSEN